MSKKLVDEAKKFRDQIPDLEGLLIGKIDGTKLWSDTLKDLKHDFILSSASVVVRAMKKMCESLEKKAIRTIDTEFEDGYVTIIVSEKAIIVAFYGDDAKTQLGLIKKNLRTFVKDIERFI